MERYVCLHCHLYQPPRENPWLEAIELQDSAYPYHDWNERITAECYAPNALARILDEEGRIVSIVNNYSRISFNFGPTLLSWMEKKAPTTYRMILEADKKAAERFSGHGSALAQVYNHMILPLANPADRYTQVLWGIRDFEHRFGRFPEGMWLPETAVDTGTLEVLAELGIQFTILAPHQARRVRRLGGRNWRDVTHAQIDPTMAYRVQLPSGRSLNVFFYDGPISRAVAFEGLLNRGENLADRLVGAFSDQRTWPQLIHIATDGETYGHHHPYGEMALAYSLHHIESKNLARLTNYGEFLERHPPTHEAEVLDNTSWSCVHGIERWRSDCGCNSGGHPGWNQAWRPPLRTALDWLRNTVAPIYERQAGEYFKDPWAARNEYIRVLLDRSRPSLQTFIHTHAGRELTAVEITTALKLLELQRHAMLMYTSCGWFFDDLSGIETVQVIEYAGRTIQLAQEVLREDLEEGFLQRLGEARSNLPLHGDGAQIYEKLVRPAMVNLEKVGAHYAISSLFEEYPEETEIYSYAVKRHSSRTLEAGKARLLVGRAQFTSGITGESAHLSYGVLHFGDQNLNGGVREFKSEEAYDALMKEVGEPFARGNFPAILRLLDKQFGESTYSLKSLFRDEQRKIVNLILESTLGEVEDVYRQVYEHHAPLMRFVTDLGMPLPRVFGVTAEFIVNANLRRALQEPEPDLVRFRSLLDVAKEEKIELDAAGLSFALENKLAELMERLREDANNVDELQTIEALAAIAYWLPFDVKLWKAQNLYYELSQTVLPRKQETTGADAETWVQLFLALGDHLSIRLPQS